MFAEYTGIVHISGVVDQNLTVGEMRDGHRVLVDESDRLGNVAQLKALIAAGYSGSISYEPFSPTVHALADPESALRKSIAFMNSSIFSAHS